MQLRSQARPLMYYIRLVFIITSPLNPNFYIIFVTTSPLNPNYLLLLLINGRCICFKFFRASANGLLRLHGPQSCCCPGSHLPVLRVQPSVSAMIKDAEPPSPTVASTIQSSPLPPPVVQQSTTFSLSSNKRVPTIRRIPKASRRLAVEKFSTLLGVVKDNSLSSWVSLLSFANNCLYSPRRGGKRWSFATIINKQLESCDGPSQYFLLKNFSKNNTQFSQDFFKNAVSSHLEEGDFRGAIRLVSSSDAIAPATESTFNALKVKHPSPSVSSSIPSAPVSVSDFLVSESEVSLAIKSFPWVLLVVQII